MRKQFVACGVNRIVLVNPGKLAHVREKVFGLRCKQDSTGEPRKAGS